MSRIKQRRACRRQPRVRRRWDLRGLPRNLERRIGGIHTAGHGCQVVLHLDGKLSAGVAVWVIALGQLVVCLTYLLPARVGGNAQNRVRVEAVPIARAGGQVGGFGHADKLH